MSRLHTLQTLAKALRDATQNHNWPAVMKVDASIAECLTGIRNQPLSPQERQALGNLKKLHQQARNYCQGQSDILAEKMDLARRNREGATAYALFSDMEEGR